MRTSDDENEFKRLLLALPEEECSACGELSATVVLCSVQVARQERDFSFGGLMETWQLCLVCREGFEIQEVEVLNGVEVWKTVSSVYIQPYSPA